MTEPDLADAEREARYVTEAKFVMDRLERWYRGTLCEHPRDNIGWTGTRMAASRGNCSYLIYWCRLCSQQAWVIETW